MDFFRPYISKKSIKLVTDVLTSGFLSEGRITEQFEKSLEKSLGIKNVVAVNSGTSALHLALVLAGVKPGDEVIVPPQTFVATATAVMQQFAKPIFADIQYETGNIDPDSIRKKITKKTKAIIAVHWAGYPCDMDQINQIAKEHTLAVIEDAAHALGATYKGKPIGSVSRFTVFSFQAIKHVTTGDGGAVCCLDDKDYEKAKKLRWFGIDRQNSKPSLLGERIYDLETAGYKYHMNNIAAAIGLGNLADFKKNLKKRRQNAAYAREGLKDAKGIQLLENNNDRESAHWIFTLLADRRAEFIKKLAEKGIPASVVHLRIDKNSAFGKLTKGLKNQEKFNEKQVSLPLHERINSKDLKYIVKTIQQGW